MVFPYGSLDTLALISAVGYSFFLFLGGVKMDVSMITRTGKKAGVIAVLSFVIPILVGFPSAVLLETKLAPILGDEIKNLHVVSITHGLTSFIVIAWLLNDLKIINSELGRLAITSAMVSDMLNMTFGIFLNAGDQYKEDHTGALLNIASLAVFVIVALVLRPALFWVVSRTPKGRPVKDVYIYAIILMVLLFGLLTSTWNRSFFLGPLIFGLVVPEGPPLGTALLTKLECFVSWFLLPLFVTTCVMKVDLSLDYGFLLVIVNAILVLLMFLAKVLACLVPALYCKMPLYDAFALSLILSTKGVLEMAFYSVLYDDKIISERTYGIMAISVLLIASVVPISVRFLYDPSRKYAGYQTRNILSLKPNAELKILACIHKPNHINVVINLLDLFCPRAENPIFVFALHLIEMIGRSSPIFICHQIQRKDISGSKSSYSENVILAFDLYQHENIGAVTVNSFTAVSPANLMHEDICTLALDKLTSFILLPFHRKWSIDGSIEAEDNNLRALNCSVLERAPCSVGILVSRGRQLGMSLCRVAMIFQGGNDDREALALAKRAAKDSRNFVVVYHLIANDYDSGLSKWDIMLDSLVMKEVKNIEPGVENVIYREMAAESGPQTNILRAMVDAYDYIIVGRRHGINSPHTIGLTEWTEFSELGVIGDLLASSDFKGRASILVVQQQQVSKWGS
ncbi:Cation/H(+) antiporter like [Quillaja saponaria]|uniref:Cation/H(+) antiporter like n=1 Tax=Quillaja saponaria TaxID=32244 RepID=A0AAD7VN78_QUISA|nr:Cation/H(+) antiporter like [Quillaja saponaria]